MRVDVESAIVAYLRESGFQCWADKPASPPAEYCLVDRTGGTYEGFVDRATVSLDCIAPTRARALELAISADDAMPGLVSRRGIGHVVKQSIQNLSHLVAGDDGKYRCVYTIITFDSPE